MGKHKELSTDERNVVVQFLLGKSTNGKPAYGAFKEVATSFCITRGTASRLWKAKRERSSQRKIVARMGVSKTTVQRWYKLHLLIAHTSALHPQLSADNKLLRIRFSLEALELDRILNRIRFSNMHNIVHIDEKWFYITKGSHRYYLAPDEEVPYRSCQSKKFIGKIMFVCAVSRPILAENGEVLFDGKIGIWPMMESVQAIRNSKTRPKGTRYNKPIQSITRDVMKQTLIEKIIPAIRHKWPQGASKHIKIQQDNAKPHIRNDDPDFQHTAHEGEFHMQLVQQPPNSPDTNVLGLGFFDAIQSLQHERPCSTLDELVEIVKESFYNISPTTLNNVFLSLQGCLIEILKVKGHNNYKLPHMGKEALIKTGDLPLYLEVEKELVSEAITFLIEAGHINGVLELGYRLGVQERFGLLELFGCLLL